eukprot:CAMPEP_0203745924 /NCGR_PEP_ID=MMETSP0098-20131031/1520_1 /ASSEMBLY_ACC=CAM_ASM_000208 /TAXON_ID=96639 /ORGANISM=" , Strain NY0313808BC1" /LENGTH=474 /DNA_ID=CAMNT_0050633849 /DNA_START=447 /DNA_END=1871 /DNA_ORIENTATION=-
MEIDMSHVQQKRKVSDRVAYGQEESFLGYLVHSTKEVLLGSKMNVLMLLTPLAYIVDASGSDHNHGAVFLLSLSAIVPFAERLGYVTEQLAMHTNDTLGGLLNASFGNATEVIISLFALLKARPDQANAVMYQRLVLVSMLGSVLSNLLFVFGSALLVGGMRYKRQHFNRSGASVSSALLLVSCAAYASPYILTYSKVVSADNILVFSRVVAALLFVVYFFFLFFQLKTHRFFYENDTPTSPPARARRQGGFMPVRKSSDRLDSTEFNGTDFGVSNRLRAIPDAEEGYFSPSPGATTPTSEISAEDGFSNSDDDDELVLGFVTALVWLGIISAFISFLSDLLVKAVKGTTISWGLANEFIGIILIPVVGNAAEHASAVVFAYRNKMDIALGVALGSATQIAVSVLPFCILLAWGMKVPLTLTFQPFEILSLLIAVLTVSVVVQNGSSHWLHGVVLICVYIMLTVAFALHENTEP